MKIRDNLVPWTAFVGYNDIRKFLDENKEKARSSYRVLSDLCIRWRYGHQ